MTKAAQLLRVKSAMTSSLLADRSCAAGRMGGDTMLLRGMNMSALVLLLCVRALHGSALPAVSSYEFTAYRMQQYNLAQQKHGRSGHLRPRASHRLSTYIIEYSSFQNFILNHMKQKRQQQFRVDM